ncbi:hypothetical protein ADENT20671_1048 [Actinomyces denticolens]|nr:hypothetical protein ADENT20671_1048 [Actinomyces denticolens]
MVKRAEGCGLVGGQGGGGQIPEERGDGVLPALLDAQVLGKRAEEALEAGLGELGGGVLRPQGQRQGVAARGPGGLLGGRLGAGLGRGGQGVARRGEGRRRRLMAGRGLDLLATGAPVGPRGLAGAGSGLLQRALSGGPPLLGGGQGGAGLLPGGSGGLVAGARGGQAPACASHFLPVLGLGALEGGERALGGALRGLGLRPLLGGGGQGAAGRLDPLGELGLLGGGGLGAPVQLVGVGTEGRLGRVGQAPDALSGDVGE